MILSDLFIVLLCSFVQNGYSVNIANITIKGDGQVTYVAQAIRHERQTNNHTKLEAQAKDAERRLVELSAERRASYESIRNRRNYYKRDERSQGDDGSSRQQGRQRQQDAEAEAAPDVLEPQESARPTLHSLHSLHTLSKQSVITFDNKFYQFGLKIPKRISTKLSPVDEWATTALPIDTEMENLVMPLEKKYSPKLPRVMQQANPLPLSSPNHASFPLESQMNNENNKRILSEMSKEFQMNAARTPSVFFNSKTPAEENSTPAGASVHANQTSNSENVTNEEATTVKIEMSTGRLSTNVSSETGTINKTPNNSSSVVEAGLPQQTGMTNSLQTNSTTAADQTHRSESDSQGRSFPTGFNDFRRENEDDVQVMSSNTDAATEVTSSPPTTTTNLVTSPLGTVTLKNPELKDVTADVEQPEFAVNVSKPVEDERTEYAETDGQQKELNFSTNLNSEESILTENLPPEESDTQNLSASPPYLKILPSPEESESPPSDVWGNGSNGRNLWNSSDIDGSILVSVLDEGAVSAQSFGIALYFLAAFGLVPLVLALVFLAKYFLSRSRKMDCESDASSLDAQAGSSRGARGACELSKSPSSATTITLVHGPLPPLPRIPHKAPSWQLQRHHLTLLSVLGQGNFGQVWKAEIEEGTNRRLVAVKTVKEGATDKEQEDIIKEMHIMAHAGHHPNVVQLIGCCTERDPYYLVMEYVPNGKLLTFLRDHRTQGTYYNFSTENQVLTSRDLTVFMYCVARGMEYLVSKRIIHRDLAARNILVDQNKMCKIADFGMSRLTQEDTDGEIFEERQHRGALPIRWMAPESLHYSLFTHKSDVWSFGILVWETVTLGSTPYPSLGAREVVQGVRNGLRLQKPLHVNNELFKLVARCWAQDPSCRPNFTELRLHLADLLDGSCVDLDSFALNNSNKFQLQTRSRTKRSKNTGKGTVTLVGNGSFTVNSRILDSQFSIV